MAQFKNRYEIEPHTFTVSVGSLPDFYVDPAGFQLNWRGEGKSLENPILTSELRCVCRCDETHEAFITSVGTLATTGVVVTVTKDGDFFWAGIMQGEAVQLQYDSGAGYWFEVTAVDGLALLKEIDFDNEGVQYEGTASVLQHVADCLKKLPYVPGVWGSSAAFLKSAEGWLAVQHAGATDNPVRHTWINRRVWYDYDSKGSIKATSCWDVLKNVLGMYAARIYQVEGFWFIEQPLIRNENTFPGYQYDYDLNASAATLNGERSIQCGDESVRVAPGGHTDWLPAIREAKFIWKARQRRNWLPGYNRKNTDASTNYMGDVLDYSSGKVSLRFTAKLRINLVNSGYVGFDGVFVKFQFYLKIGPIYLRRDLNLQNGLLTPSNYGWDVAVNGYEFAPPIFPSPNISNFSQTYNLSFTTPVLPTAASTSGQLEFWLEQMGIFKALTGAGTSGLSTEWEFFDTYIEVLVDGRPINGNAVIEYSAPNTTDEFGEPLEFESLLADRVDVNDLGGLFAGTSTTPSTFWGDFSGARTLKLGNLWCERMVRFRKKPRQRMYGQFYGGYFPIWKRLNDGVKRWVMVSASYTAAQDLIEGEWIELEKSGEVVSARDPTGKDVDPTHLNGWPGPGLPPPGGDGGFGGEDERMIPGLLYSLASNYTGDPIMSGAVTALPLKYPTKAGVFVEGDYWVIMDPANGRNFTATVATSADEGDTTVAITGTASDIIPAESMILYPLTNLTTTTLGAVRWKRWFGAVASDEIVLPLPDNPLPLDPDRIMVWVEGILYDAEMGDPTYTVDHGANKIVFSRTELDGLNAVVRVL